MFAGQSIVVAADAAAVGAADDGVEAGAAGADSVAANDCLGSRGSVGERGSR